MQDDLNQPPEKVEVTNNQAESVFNATELPAFYIVSLNKFLLLFMGTAGLYMTYWFYKQWACYKQSHQGHEWPVLRGIFSVFFVPSLFTKLTDLYQAKSGKKSTALNTAAKLFIVVAVINFISSNISVSAEVNGYLALVNFITTPLFCWFCYQAQWFVNYVCDDPDGDSNKVLSAVNYAWLGVGIVLWAVYFIYVVLPLFK